MGVDQGSGVRVLEDPLTNKGTAFSEEERSGLGLRGLLPSVVETLEQQTRRRYQAYQEQPTDLARHINLRALQDTNETLFYRLVSDHIEEMLPVLYTPTVGLACQRFSEIYRRPRGLFIAYPDRDRVGEILRNRPRREVDVIVVTDGQRVLGLGDQGIGGMGIPIGKLSLYAALGGIDPARTLPVLLDVGTDNAGLLADPMYLGWRHRRLAAADYDDFVDRFVQAIRTELPGVLLQWEDFATPHALPILERYRDQLLSFNDDIQGTAAVVLAALSAGAAATGSRLRDQTVLMLGAGSAGIGVCEQVVQAMAADGLSGQDARARIFVVDINGLLTTDRPDLSPAQRRLAQPPAAVASSEPGRPAGLTDVIDAVHPTTLIGLSAATGAFTEQVVRRIAAHTKRPIIMPLSNPTSRSEARPQDLADWTAGRALVATGSPFPPMRVGEVSVPVAQCNNIYVFPGVGLGVTAVRATRVTDAMMTAAAAAVGAAATIRHDPHGTLLPDRAQLAGTATAVATAVAKAAVADAVAPALTDDQIDQAIDRTRWQPRYQWRLPCRDPVGDGADDDVGAGAQHGRQEQPPLVLQDPVTPPAWLNLGDEDGDLPAALLCLPDVVHDRVHQRAVRAVEGLQPHPGIPAVPVGAERRALGGFGVDADGDDIVAQGQRRVQGVLGELADVADGHDHQAVGRPRSGRQRS
jgi:malate dehydrogenase (oxaloacetate-decarboxylating)